MRDIPSASTIISKMSDLAAGIQSQNHTHASWKLYQLKSATAKAKKSFKFSQKFLTISLEICVAFNGKQEYLLS